MWNSAVLWLWHWPWKKVRMGVCRLKENKMRATKLVRIPWFQWQNPNGLAQIIKVQKSRDRISVFCLHPSSPTNFILSNQLFSGKWDYSPSQITLYNFKIEEENQPRAPIQNIPGKDYNHSPHQKHGVEKGRRVFLKWNRGRHDRQKKNQHISQTPRGQGEGKGPRRRLKVPPEAKGRQGSEVLQKLGGMWSGKGEWLRVSVSRKQERLKLQDSHNIGPGGVNVVFVGMCMWPRAGKA